MPFTSIFPGVYEMALGPINLFLIEDADGLTLIDTGYANQEQQVVAAVEQIGKRPADIRNILITHCHPDHAGSLAALQRITGAPAWMHRADAEVVRGHTPMVRSRPSPGLVSAIFYRIFIKNVPPYVPPAPIEHELQDGDVLPVGGGLRAIHTPGHSAGHMAFLLPRDGGLLFVADACSNMMGLSYSIVYDDIKEGRRSLSKLAQLDFTAVCFSHGKVRQGAAAVQFKRKWAMK